MKDRRVNKQEIFQTISSFMVASSKGTYTITLRYLRPSFTGTLLQ